MGIIKLLSSSKSSGSSKCGKQIIKDICENTNMQKNIFFYFPIIHFWAVFQKFRKTYFYFPLISHFWAVLKKYNFNINSPIFLMTKTIFIWQDCFWNFSISLKLFISTSVGSHVQNQHKTSTINFTSKTNET